MIKQLTKGNEISRGWMTFKERKLFKKIQVTIINIMYNVHCNKQQWVGLKRVATILFILIFLGQICPSGKSCNEVSPI